ncbi:hypothetical protein BGZ89_006738 [Linnemannia elongata]|nr:hypothetical protein BGZ89_006738 [Linnemannia elongata]
MLLGPLLGPGCDEISSRYAEILIPFSLAHLRIGRSIQCGLLNDVGSFIKDKDLLEIKYYIDVSPKKTQDQE